MRQLASTFCASVGFSQLSVRPWYLPSTSVNILCPWDLPKRSVQLLVLPSTSVNFLCSLGTLRQLSVHPRDLQSTFCASAGSSINFPCGLGTFRQHFVWPGTFYQLQSTFHAFMGPSLNFLCGCGTFRQHSLWLDDLSVNFRECSVHLWDFTSILHASVNFCQVSVHPGDLCQLSLYLRDLQRTSVNFPCIRRIFCKPT